MTTENQPHLAQLPAQLQDALEPISSAWKVRAAKFFLKLVGSTAAKQAMFSVSDDFDTMRGRSIVSDALARSVAEELSADPDTVRRAASRYLADEVIKQRNLEAIATKAAEEIGRLPAPEQTADSGGDDEAQTDEVSDDWRQRFARMAGEVSDTEMQSIWARLLAGEIKSPGGYSYTTLRILSEMDRRAALDFSDLMSFRFGRSLLYDRENQLRTGNVYRIVGAMLSRGLLMDGDLKSSGNTVEPNDRGLFWVVGNHLACMIGRTANQGAINIPVLRLSREAEELCTLLPHADEAPAAEHILQGLMNVRPDAQLAAIASVKDHKVTGWAKFVRGSPGLL